ncbi:1,2-phenylacetyl-CoA epoxidase subunit PaaD [Porticoccus sp. W117]|uniref:1,2-phenylacetyl-CoA epoxidase subunit PaaD n=1 Tax=Porticoccus sp. W117 TaxID=3054777 RepID=UPI0025994A3E|nr:1,2-phenylacetyl-CoA epoxidase subunit PaaD [Porticoccus sp. W117]MDM3872495.1 1,2-phenylacetyl-CoA epoxidase subunit PaaD [Porticoccus sp. W117]
MVSLIPTVSIEQVERDQHRANPATAAIWNLLDAVHDPEVPVLSLWDLGVLRNVEKQGDKITVTLTPTYSGCPAINTMAEDVDAALKNAGYRNFEIRNQLAPAWTTDWLSPEGRRKLKEYGIAPPQESSTCRKTSSDKASLFAEEPPVPCPQCDSSNTLKISEFGSTACKALYKCQDCHEPFDYFKCL